MNTHPFSDIASHLEKRNETLAIAESCTGGLLSGFVTGHSGVSKVYLGGVVSYADSAKAGLIGVDMALIEKHGAVSREVALAMAEGVRKKLRSSWSVAITGIAGPTGGTPDKPVGTVWFAVVGPESATSDHKKFEGSREDVRDASVQYALKFLREQIHK